MLHKEKIEVLKSLEREAKGSVFENILEKVNKGYIEKLEEKRKREENFEHCKKVFTLLCKEIKKTCSKIFGEGSVDLIVQEEDICLKVVPVIYFEHGKSRCSNEIKLSYFAETPQINIVNDVFHEEEVYVPTLDFLEYEKYLKEEIFTPFFKNIYQPDVYLKSLEFEKNYKEISKAAITFVQDFLNNNEEEYLADLYHWHYNVNIEGEKDAIHLANSEGWRSLEIDYDFNRKTVSLRSETEKFYLMIDGIETKETDSFNEFLSNFFKEAVIV